MTRQRYEATAERPDRSGDGTDQELAYDVRVYLFRSGQRWKL